MRARSLLLWMWLGGCEADPTLPPPPRVPLVHPPDAGAGDGGRLYQVRSSTPAPGAGDVPVTAWLTLELTTSATPALTLRCAGEVVPARAERLGEALLVNPAVDLPGERECTLSAGEEALLSFRTAAVLPGPVALYDREDHSRLAPLPDDTWRVPPTSTAAARVEIPPVERPFEVASVLTAYLEAAGTPDGFSPLAPLVVETSGALDPRSLPRTSSASLEPTATLGLFDLDPLSPGYRQRLPFRLYVRDDVIDGLESHALLVFPAHPLEPQGRYGLVVSRRALAEPARTLARAPYFERALASPDPEDSAMLRRTRAHLAELSAVLGSARPAWDQGDLALGLVFTVRSDAGFAADVLAGRRRLQLTPPPRWQTASVSPGQGEVAALVRGRWEAPDLADGVFLRRGPDGRPAFTSTQSLDFFLALPRAALAGPVPLIMYQHGQPSSGEEGVFGVAEEYAQAGFAVVGFTDFINRRFPPPAGGGREETLAWGVEFTNANLETLLQRRRHPDYPLIVLLEQLAFLRLIRDLGSLDLLPLGAPDGAPELAVSRPLGYAGQSKGSVHGTALLPYAPEISAAVLQAGGGNEAAITVHQLADVVLAGVEAVFNTVAPIDVWVAISLDQWAKDPQDPQNHARYLYRRPVVVDGWTKKASVLSMEGLHDGYVSAVSTRGAAWAFGPLLHLEPRAAPVPFLAPAHGPLRGNVDATTTAAFYQYVPLGVPGLPPTPGCAERGIHEGHFCPAGSAEGRRQRARFFQSNAAGQVPEIIDPLTP